MDTYQFDKLPHVLAMAFASHKAAQAPAVAQKVAEETRNQVTKEINENKKAFAEKSKPSAPVNKKESLADLEARLADVKF
jgi:ABC-type transporter MlaC component